jgi:hypothetical protein
VLPQLID